MFQYIKIFLPLIVFFLATPFSSHAGPWSYSSLRIPSFEGQVNASSDIDLDTYKLVLRLQAYKSTLFDNRGYNAIEGTKETIIVDINEEFLKKLGHYQTIRFGTPEKYNELFVNRDEDLKHVLETWAFYRNDDEYFKAKNRD